LICTWWRGERSGTWLDSQSTTKLSLYSIKSLHTTGLNVLTSNEIILKSNVFVMSLTCINIFFLNKVRKIFEVPSYIVCCILSKVYLIY
jgi:hypothetical protein